MSRYPEAVAAYRESVRLKPDDPLLRNNLAWHVALSGANIEEAVAMARTAMEKDPANVQFADTLGVIYLKSKQLDLALQTLQRVVNKEPSNPEFRIHFAQALIAQGQVQKARSELNFALSAKPLPAAQEEQIRKLLKNI
jgi:Flp pilus assembly protein TadD